MNYKHLCLMLSLISLLQFITIGIQSLTISSLRDYNLELKEEVNSTKEKLSIFQKLSYGLFDHCIELEKERASCNVQTKECNE